MNIALVTPAYGRPAHLALQVAGAASSVRPASQHVIVSDSAPDLPPSPGAPHRSFVPVPRTPGPLPIAEARNLGADHALESGADLLIFLDVDCVPGPDLIACYESAAARRPDALLSGPVVYLPPPPPGGYRLSQLPQMGHPHPARPAPEPGQLEPLSHTLFWSLSFAVTAGTWNRIGGFHGAYRGYGGEDTDFAQTALSRGVEHVAVGGAVAYHQWHPTQDPPTQHLTDIVRNAAIFNRRWGWWPMRGWLDAFARDRLIIWDPLSKEWRVSASTEDISR
jgi:GT2 family glycosyltransferase